MYISVPLEYFIAGIRKKCFYKDLINPLCRLSHITYGTLNSAGGDIQHFWALS